MRTSYACRARRRSCSTGGGSARAAPSHLFPQSGWTAGSDGVREPPRRFGLSGTRQARMYCDRRRPKPISQDPARVTSLSQWTSGGVRLGTPGAAETPRYFVTQTLSLEHSPLRGRYGLKGDTHYKSKGR
jgi:hypothetical protein